MTEFRKPRIDSLIERAKGKKLIAYPETRFCYMRDTMISILMNIRLFRQFCDVNDLEISETVKQEIRSARFVLKLKSYIKLFTPICKLINKCQDPKLNIADGTEHWMNLLCSEIESNELQTLLIERISKALSPAYYAANILHHRYQARSLRRQQRDIGEQFITQNLGHQGLEERTRFDQNPQNYKGFTDSCECPITFWIFLSHFYPALSKFALKLMNMPASTALIEGFFSHWTYVQNKYRNSMSFSTSYKSIHTYHILRSGAYKREKKKRFSRFPLNFNIDYINDDELEDVYMEFESEDDEEYDSDNLDPENPNYDR